MTAPRPPRPALAPDAGFLRLAGACAIASAVTTLLLWALPRAYAAPDDFESAIALHRNATYLARWWVNFLHTLLALVGYLGAALLLARRSPGGAALGFVFFLVWGTTELLGVAVIIFAVNGAWRTGWADADPAGREALRTLLAGWDAVWDAMFFVLLVAFLLGSLCHGWLASRGEGLERAAGVLLLLAVPLTLAILASGYGGPVWPGVAAGWVYPVLQPVGRATLGAWLWRSAVRGGA